MKSQEWDKYEQTRSQIGFQEGSDRLAHNVLSRRREVVEIFQPNWP